MKARDNLRKGVIGSFDRDVSSRHQNNDAAVSASEHIRQEIQI